MRNDSIGSKCKKDQAILLFGYRLYDKVKKRDDNVVGCRKDVRTKMRMLAHLHTYFLQNSKEDVNFKFNNIKDMFDTDHFQCLWTAIDDYTSREDNNIKPALKANLQFVLVKAANIFKGTAYTERNNSEAELYDRFHSVLKHWQNYIFGEAIKEMSIKKQEELRRP